MMPQISVDHDNAKILGKRLSEIEGLLIDINKIHTNIITCSVEKLNITIDEFLLELLNEGIKAKKISKTSFRMVTHYGIGDIELDRIVEVIKEIVKARKER